MAFFMHKRSNTLYFRQKMTETDTGHAHSLWVACVFTLILMTTVMTLWHKIRGAMALLGILVNTLLLCLPLYFFCPAAPGPARGKSPGGFV